MQEIIEAGKNYHRGFAEGYRAGWTKACEGLDEMVKTLSNPPPIIIQGVELAALKTVEGQKPPTNKANTKLPSEGVFMEWASSKNFNCSQAASTYDWFARKLMA